MAMSVFMFIPQVKLPSYIFGLNWWQSIIFIFPIMLLIAWVSGIWIQAIIRDFKKGGDK